jgi:hypothetical protein
MIRLAVGVPLMAMMLSFILLTTQQDWQMPVFMVLSLLAFPMIAEKPILGLYALIFLSPLFSPKVNLGFANLYMHQLVIISTTVSLIFYYSIILKKEINIKLSPGLTVFTFLFLVSFFNTPSLSKSIKWTLFFAVMINAYALTVLVLKERDQLKRLLCFQGVSLVILLLNAIVSSLGDLLSGGSYRLTGGSIFDNPNSFGNYLAMIIPFLLGVSLYLPKKHLMKRWSQVVLSFAAFILVFTYSRSSWLGLMVGTTVIFFYYQKKMAILFFLFMSCLAVVTPAISNRALSLTGGGDGDALESGLLYRLLKSQLAIERFKENPLFGNGPGSFQHFAENSDVPYLMRHSTLENLYILILTEEGALGLLVFLVMSWLYLRHTHRLFHGSRSSLFKGAILGCLGCYVSILFIGLGEAVIFFPKYNWFIGFVMALPKCLNLIEEKEWKAYGFSQLPIAPSLYKEKMKV